MEIWGMIAAGVHGRYGSWPKALPGGWWPVWGPGEWGKGFEEVAQKSTVEGSPQ